MRRPLLEELRENTDVFSRLFAFRTSPLTLNAETGAERVMGTFVSGVDLLLTSAGLMGAIGITAAAVPAWRAARVDPLQALR